MGTQIRTSQFFRVGRQSHTLVIMTFPLFLLSIRLLASEAQRYEPIFADILPLSRSEEQITSPSDRQLRVLKNRKESQGGQVCDKRYVNRNVLTFSFQLHMNQQTYYPSDYVDREDYIPPAPTKRDTGSQTHSFIQAPSAPTHQVPQHVSHSYHQPLHRVPPPYHNQKKRKTFKFALPTLSLGLKKFEIHFSEYQ